MRTNKLHTFPKDNPEWTPERVARARPFRQVFPNADTSKVIVPVAPARSKRRGSEKAPVKEQIALRLSSDVIAGLRATGPGWAALADELLRAGLKRLRKNSY